MVKHRWIVGIVGTYAAGKSTVTKIFVEEGFTEINVDKVGHAVLEEKKSDIVACFGKSILQSNHQIDRRILGSLVFPNPAALDQLNAIMHPAIYRHVESLLNKLAPKPIVIDAALLFEIGIHHLCTHILALTTNRETAIERGLERDGRTMDQIEQILQSQEKINKVIQDYADSHVAESRIENNGSLEELDHQVRRWIAHL